MKIDKIIFSSTEEFSPFWNLQSFIWKEIFEIEPVCILWGDVKNTDMSDKYGTIIEKKYNPNLIKSLQLTWSKFYNTTLDLDSTWMIGDIDLYPLQTKFFTETIKHLNDDFYTHLATNAISDTLYELKGGHLPAYYHVAKGSTLSKALSLEESSFEDQVNDIINDGRFTYHNEWSQEEAEKHFGEKSGNRVHIEKEELLCWLADERFSSFKIFDSHEKNKITFTSSTSRKIEIHPRYDSKKGKKYPQNRVDRSYFKNSHYKIFNGSYAGRKNLVDIHCHKIFEEQKQSLYEIVERCLRIKIPSII